ncbi:hypothetical protein IOK49_06605 [Fervidicoccus fontis]|uniref:Uncharacterized protein n=2 Tax=Fervidicoccus fontis TaxID=683846 RepID=I0A030_FERFK|nr:hypothetical protein [Fervidicoccus fontis]AFH42337.1 hypothetical protein FFONT_0347 [Fervidicoccus fontis Kam940]MBE9391733.1 hypothetical protein [Fervidicoccus fontis]PMB76846.1 MAG: hypothetical protein C0177_04930 [Fervidicoccus fontis]HEW63617.1 hypothetical protein [Fervidicoccus fontis]
MTENKSNENEEKKITITIRGIDKDLYEKISNKAKQLNTTVGSLVNEAIGNLLASIDIGIEKTSKIVDTTIKAASEAIKTPLSELKSSITTQDYIIISNIGEITVSKNDLESSEKPLIFVNVKRIVFADNVTEELIKNKVRAIKVSDEVIIPKTISSMTIAQKSQFVKKITSK